MRTPEVKYAKSGDLSIAYQVVGQGPPDLVAVNGFVSNLEMLWSEPVVARLWSAATRWSRVVMFDKRGTGLSDPFTGAPPIEERMDDVRAVMDSAGIEKAVLLGISEGGPIATTFAATYPERVTHLILYGTFAVMNPEEGGLAPTDLVRMLDAVDRWGTGATLDVFAPSVADRPLQRRMWSLWERMGASPRMAKSIFELNMQIDIRAVLPMVSAPTLVLHKEGDVVPLRQGRYLADHIPSAKLVVLPGADHVPFANQEADRLHAEVQEFVTGVRPAERPDRVLATVLFTDIVDSTTRADAIGDAAWGEVIARHDQLTRALLAEHRGREIKTLGDGFLATFDGPGRAIECARQLVGEVAGLGLQVRAGIHTGECDVTVDDVRGIAVNVAARVCALARGGQVLTTATVRDLSAGSGISFAEHGEHELKGVHGTWPLFSAGETDRPTTPLPTSTPAHRRGDRLLETMAVRFPRTSRAGVRLLRRLPG